jgi:hypothetical protein
MNSQVTFVTAYYYVSSNSTSKHEYVTRGEKTLRIQQPMIIFCESEMRDFILRIRTELNLLHMTQIIVIPYEELFFYQFRDMIESNRERYWPTRDSRAHTDVHIICISKFYFLQRAIMLNPFQTSHMAWIDFSLLGKVINGSNNYINEDIYEKINIICQNPRPKFTIQILQIWSPEDYQNLREFYSIYRWIACGGFFTMDIQTGLNIILKIIDKVIEITENGYGHGEESFFSYIIDENLDSFNLTIGDYQDMIHNYYKITTNEHYVNWALNKCKGRNKSIQPKLKKLVETICQYEDNEQKKLVYQKLIL